MINVLDDPDVHGDGVQDDQPGLKALIDAAAAGGDGTLYFPPARYRIESTLNIPQKSGYHFIGCGLAPPLHDGSASQGAESVIIWGGEDNGTMIQYEGVGLVWNGLSLWGCALGGSSSSCPTARAQHGILVKRPNGSLGTGKAWFDSILIAHCDQAIATANTLNNDTLGFGFCWLEDCVEGLHLTNGNSIQYTFQHVYARDVGTIFKVADGGRIFTQCVSVVTDETIVLDMIVGGKNNAYYQLGGIVIDEGATDITLVRDDTTVSENAGDHVVRFTDGHFRNTAKVVINRENGGRTTLEFVGCRGMAALASEIDLTGDTSTDRILAVVKDCDLSGVTDAAVASLIKSGSTDYWAEGLDNWEFASGSVTDTDDSNP